MGECGGNTVGQMQENMSRVRQQLRTNRDQGQHGIGEGRVGVLTIIKGHCGYDTSSVYLKGQVGA